jgi:hypothetical protein
MRWQSSSYVLHGQHSLETVSRTTLGLVAHIVVLHNISQRYTASKATMMNGTHNATTQQRKPAGLHSSGHQSPPATFICSPFFSLGNFIGIIRASSKAEATIAVMKLSFNAIA